LRFGGQAGYFPAVLRLLTVEKLEGLRDRLQQLGTRNSMRFPSASLDIVEVMTTLEKYGPMCEAMYLMMAADGKVLNVERAVLRGALEIIGKGQVRTAHMEAMLDAAAKASANQGTERRLEAVIEALQPDPIKSEMAVVLCAAVAVADDKITDEEHHMLERLASGLGITEQAANRLLADLAKSPRGSKPPETT
jgi:tellurite resistance protein